MIGDDLPHSLPPGFTQVPADAESTSAALRRVEAERDSWRDHSARHRAEAERLEALVIERTRERGLGRAELASALQELALTGRELDQAAQDREDLTAQLGTARQELDRLRRVSLPADDREVMEWFAFHGLDPAAPPVTVFAYLREDFNQPTEGA